jgi:hypothetical protein
VSIGSGTIKLTDGSNLPANAIIAGALVDVMYDGTNFQLLSDSSGGAEIITNLTLTGNLSFTGTGNRILGDFSNGTVANRVAFQTSTTNGNTSITAIPNGTSTTSSFQAFNTNDPANTSATQVLALSTESSFRNAINGTGTYLPMTFFTSGSERMRIDTSGNVGIGTASPVTLLTVDNGLITTGRYANSGAIVLRSASGTQASPTAISTSTLLSVIVSRGYDGTTYRDVGSITTVSDGAVSSTSSPGAMAFNTTPSGSTNLSERMRIDSSGNVGIGLTPTSTGGRLQVDGTTNTASAKFSGNANGMSVLNQTGLTIYTNLSAGSVDTTLVAGATASTYMAFGIHNGTSYSERMRIDSSGNVGIGTTSPVGKLNVIGGLGVGAALTGDNAITPLASGGILISGGNQASLQTYTSVGSGTTVGALNYYAATDQGFSRFFDIAAYGSTTGATGNIRFLTGSSTSTERMRIDGSGNVGIGTASPSAPLTVASSTTLSAGSPSILFQGSSNTERMHIRSSFSGGGQAVTLLAGSNGTVASPTAITNQQVLGYYQLGGYDGTTWQRASWITGNAEENWSGTNRGSSLSFATTPIGSTTIAERMRIDSSGNVLFNTTDTTLYNNTSGNGVCYRVNASLDVAASSDNCLILNRMTSTGPIAEFRYAGSIVGSISVTGSATTYNTSSDYRLKENVAPMVGALDTVLQLKPVTYNWKVDGSDGQGFIAHELAEVVPNCVTGEKDAVDEDGKPVYQGIDTSFLVATLTAAIQEMKAIIDAQSARITTLENK